MLHKQQAEYLLQYVGGKSTWVPASCGPFEIWTLWPVSRVPNQKKSRPLQRMSSVQQQEGLGMKRGQHSPKFTFSQPLGLEQLHHLLHSVFPRKLKTSVTICSGPAEPETLS